MMAKFEVGQTVYIKRYEGWTRGEVVGTNVVRRFGGRSALGGRYVQVQLDGHSYTPIVWNAKNQIRSEADFAELKIQFDAEEATSKANAQAQQEQRKNRRLEQADAILALGNDREAIAVYLDLVAAGR